MKGATIIVNNVSATFGGNEVLKNVSFTLRAGEHLAVMGASGSGKTTLARILAAQLFAKGFVAIQYDEASSLYKKVVLTEQRYHFKNLSHTTDFYYQQRYNSFDNNDALTVLQELALLSGKENAGLVETLLQQFGLYERRHAPLLQLSSGEHKKFQLVKALVSRPQILILDAPFTGLDATARGNLHKIINRLADGGTKIILITDSQQMPECITHLAVLEGGLLSSFLPKDESIDASDVYSFAHPFGELYSLPVSENADQPEEMIHMHNVSVRYSGKPVLTNISWTIKRGEKWLLKGANGAGKSTLVSLITGDNPQAYKNEIFLFGKRRGSGESIWDIKQKIGYVSPELHAFYDRQTTCTHAIASGFFDTIGLFRTISRTQQEIVDQWLRFLNLEEDKHKPFRNLSFGTQRLVLLARAMVKNPPLLILDEPCQGLDDEQKNGFVQLINDLCEEFGKTLIYISHYEEEIPACIGKVFELQNGAQQVYVTRAVHAGQQYAE